eukprot:6214847-Pleurochrysis_carterae.AAC.3
MLAQTYPCVPVCVPPVRLSPVRLARPYTHTVHTHTTQTLPAINRTTRLARVIYHRACIRSDPEKQARRRSVGDGTTTALCVLANRLPRSVYA